MINDNNGFLQCLKQLDTSIYQPTEQACIPVFRALSLNARTIIQRLIYTEEGRTLEKMIIAQISSISPQQVLETAIQLKIIKRIEDKPQQEQQYIIQLDQDFLIAMRDAIEGRSKSILQLIGNSEQNDDELKQECSYKWKNLFDLISNRDKSLVQKFRPRIQQTLAESRLLEYNSGVGFSFILSTTQKQINFILKNYVQRQSAKVIRFILNLSVLDPKNIYQMPQEEWQKDIILDLAELGFTSKIGNSVRITYLLWNFLYEPPSINIGISCRIIVEANFKIYAYIDQCDSQEGQILCNLLNLFSKIQKRFSILIVADLSEESIRNACNQNLEAKQIIQFLEMKSVSIKEQVQEKQQITNQDEIKKRLDFLRVFQDNVQEKAPIPHNIVQQIQYWENQFKMR